MVRRGSAAAALAAFVAFWLLPLLHPLLHGHGDGGADHACCCAADEASARAPEHEDGECALCAWLAAPRPFTPCDAPVVASSRPAPGAPAPVPAALCPRPTPWLGVGAARAPPVPA